MAIDRTTADFSTFRCWEVVEDTEEPLELPAQQIQLTKAQAEYGEEMVLGDMIEEPVDSVPFGRIAAQHAKQIIIQKVREAERDKVIQQFEQKLGQMIVGVVKRVTYDFVVLDMGKNAEAVLSRDQMMPKRVISSE